MLNSFRSFAGGITAKILIALLVLSFAAWGIGDMFRNRSANAELARVGDAVITRSAFEREYRRETERLREQLGAHYSPELLKAIGLQQQVLNSMVNRQLFIQESRALGLLPPEESLARAIRNNDMFLQANGSFDRAVFQSFLRQNSLTEKDYLALLGEEMATQLLLDAVTAQGVVPDIAARTLHSLRNEQRSADIILISPSQGGAIAMPDDAALEAYYKANAKAFTTPEYRTISYVTFGMENAARDIRVPDEEIAQAYQERKAEFERPERRRVEQLLFDTEENARSASELLASGISVKEAASKLEAKNKENTSLGEIVETGLPAEARQAVFSLPQGQHTAPVKTPFGWHVFLVSEIIPAGTLPLDKARAQLEKELREQKAAEALNAFSTRLEDALGGGTPLAHAARELGLTLHQLGPVDQAGNSPENKKIAQLPEIPGFLDVVFKTEAGSDSTVNAGGSGSFYLLHVDAVTPEATPPLEKVKAEIRKRWEEEEREKRVRAMANELAAKLKDQTTRAEALSGIAILEVKHISRDAPASAGGTELPAPLVDELFGLREGESSAAHATREGGYAIAILRARQTPPLPTSAQLKSEPRGKALAQALEQQTKGELLQQYVEYLRKKYKVTMDVSALAPTDTER